MASQNQPGGVEKKGTPPNREAAPANIEVLLEQISRNTTFLVFRPPAGDNPEIQRALANIIMARLSPYHEITVYRNTESAGAHAAYRFGRSFSKGREAVTPRIWTAAALKDVVTQIAKGGLHLDSREDPTHRSLYIWEGMLPFNPDVIGALYPEIANVLDAIGKGVPLEKVLAEIQTGKHPSYALNLLEMFFDAPIEEYASSQLQSAKAGRTYPTVPFWILHCPRCGADFPQYVAKHIKGDYLPPLNPDTLRGTYATMIHVIKQNAARRFSRLYPEGAQVRTGWNMLPEYTRGNAKRGVEEFSIDAAVHCPNNRKEFVEQMRRVMERMLFSSW